MAPLNNDHLRACILKCAELKRDLGAINELALISSGAGGLLNVFISTLNVAMSTTAKYHTLDTNTKQTIHKIWEDCAAMLIAVQALSSWYSTELQTTLQINVEHKRLILGKCIDPQHFLAILQDLAGFLSGVCSVMHVGGDDKLTGWSVKIRENIHQINDKVDAARELANILSPVGEYSQSLNTPTSPTRPATVTTDMPVENTHGDGNAAEDPLNRISIQAEVTAVLDTASRDNLDEVASRVWGIAQQSEAEDDASILRLVLEVLINQACADYQRADLYAEVIKRGLHDIRIAKIRDITLHDKNGNVVCGDALLKKILLNRCRETFEVGEHSAMSVKQQLGLPCFAGNLFNIGLLKSINVFQCIQTSLGMWIKPDITGDIVEIPSMFNVAISFQLIHTAGRNLDASEQGHKFMNACFEHINKIMRKNETPDKIKNMLQDLIAIRRCNWEQLRLDFTATNNKLMLRLAEAEDEINAQLKR